MVDYNQVYIFPNAFPVTFVDWPPGLDSLPLRVWTSGYKQGFSLVCDGLRPNVRNGTFVDSVSGAMSYPTLRPAEPTMMVCAGVYLNSNFDQSGTLYIGFPSGFQPFEQISLTFDQSREYTDTGANNLYQVVTVKGGPYAPANLAAIANTQIIAPQPGLTWLRPNSCAYFDFNHLDQGLSLTIKISLKRN